MNKKIFSFGLALFLFLIIASSAFAATGLSASSAYSLVKGVFGGKSYLLDLNRNTGSSGILEAITKGCVSTTTIDGLSLNNKDSVTVKLGKLKTSVWPGINACASLDSRDKNGFTTAYNARLAEGCEGPLTQANKNSLAAYNYDLKTYKSTSTEMVPPAGAPAGSVNTPGLDQSLKKCEDLRKTCVSAISTNQRISLSPLRINIEREDCKIQKDVCSSLAYLIYNLRIKQSFSTKTGVVDQALTSCMADVL